MFAWSINDYLQHEEVTIMSEETKKVIEELVKATENNDVAKAFLNGYKSGLDTAAVNQPKDEKTQ